MREQSGREWVRESGRAKNSRRTRPSKWAGECKSIPRRGARNCAPTLECGNPFSRALLLRVLGWCGVTATNTQPRNAPPGYVTATVQRSNETDIAAECALSRPTCPTRPGEPLPSARSSSGNFPDANHSNTTSLADPRCKPRLYVGVLHCISETTQYMPDGLLCSILIHIVSSCTSCAGKAQKWNKFASNGRTDIFNQVLRA